jgi:hypothetical protein
MIIMDTNNEILEKINKAKQEAIENPPKKKKGCTSCKKKKEVTTLPEIDLTPLPLIIYDEEDIIKAYNEVIRFGGIKEESKVFIKDVYKQLFNEEYVFENCASCKNTQYHKLRNYILYKLKRKI